MVDERARRSRVVVGGAVAVACLAAGVVAWSCRSLGRERERAESARAEADRARTAAIERLDRAIVAQARAALADDPAEALARLHGLARDGGSWADARDVATTALAQPLPVHILRGNPDDAKLERSIDRRYLVAWRGAQIWIGDVTSGHARTVATTQPIQYLELCDDNHAHGSLVRAGSADRIEYDLDVATGKLVEQPEDLAVAHGVRPDPRANCRATRLVDRRWHAPAFAEPRTLDPSFSWPHLTPDRAHVVAIGMRGLDARPVAVAWWDGTAPEAGPRTIAGVVTTGRIATSADGAIGVDPGERVAVAWNLRTGTHRELGRAATAAAVAPDGSWIALATGASSTIEATIQLFAPAAGPAIDTLATRGPIDTLAVSPDGRWLVATGKVSEERDLVQAWDLRGARRPRVLAGHARPKLDFGPANEIITLGDFDGIRVWRPGDEGAVAFASPAAHVALSPSGHRAVAVADRGSGELAIERVDLRAPASRTRVTTRGAVPERGELAISDAGDVIACTATGVVRWPHDGTALQPLGRHTAGDGPDRCLAIALADGALTASITHAIEWSASGERARYAAEYTGDAAPITGGPGLYGELVASADGRVVVFSGELHGAIDRSAKRMRVFANAGGFQLALSADGRRAVTGVDRGPGVVVWDTLASTAKPIALDVKIHSVALAPDGESIAIKGHWASAIATLELATGRATPLGHERSASQLGYLDASTVASVGFDGVARFWDLTRRVDRRIDIEPVGRAGDGTLQAHAIAITGGRVVIATRHAARTLRDDLPATPALLDRLPATGLVVK